MFKRNKQPKVDALQIAFYTEAAVSGKHGQIRVSNRRRNLDNKVVNFVFIGLVTPPELTPSLMEHIWTEAAAQGYVAHGLVGALQINEPEKVIEATELTQAGVIEGALAYSTRDANVEGAPAFLRSNQTH